MNPYIQENLTRLKVFIPAKTEKVWQLIATPEGISSWFPHRCTGKISPGEKLDFHWSSSHPDKFEVLQVVPHQYWEMEWNLGGKVCYKISGENPVVFTLEVTYPPTPAGKETQEMEVAPWSFLITNLKSIALGGPDLRSNISGPMWKEAFIDC